MWTVEIYDRNPYNGRVELTMDVHPQEIVSDGLAKSNMVAIRGKINLGCCTKLF